GLRVRKRGWQGGHGKPIRLGRVKAFDRAQSRAVVVKAADSVCVSSIIRKGELFPGGRQGVDLGGDSGGKANGKVRRAVGDGIAPVHEKLPATVAHSGRAAGR